MAIIKQRNLHKILFVQDSLGTGGAERSNANLWYFLREKGVQVKVIVLEHRSVGIEEEVLAAGFEVVFLNYGSVWQQAKAIARIIRAYQPDLVHSVLFKASLRARLAKLKADFFLIESLVSCPYDPVRLNDQHIDRYKLAGYQILDGLTARLFVDQFIPITQVVLEHYQKYLRLSIAKMHVIYRGRAANPYDKIKERQRLAHELSLDSNKIWLVQVGRQEFAKRYNFTLSSLIILSNEISSKIEMIFLGRAGNASREIEQFMVSHPKLSAVHFLGHRADVPQFLKASDVFLFPSAYEGLGGALIEAQAAGLPIICTDIPVLNEVVEKDHNALMFGLEDVNAYAQHIRKLINDASLRLEMGKFSEERFAKTFVLDQIHQDTFTFYQELISSKV